MRKLLNNSNKPAFFTRISNIVIIQVLFVFSALIFIIFFPEKKEITDTDFLTTKNSFEQLTQIIPEHLNANFQPDRTLQNQIDSLSARIDYGSIVQTQLFICSNDNEISQTVNLYLNKETSEQNGGEPSSDLADFQVINFLLDHNENDLVTRIPTTDHIVHYFGYNYDSNRRAVLQMVIEHNFLVTSKGLLYLPLFILFLASTLVSLLTIYLINNKFKDPLERIILGMEKTTQGELYYMVEPEKDSEIKKLATSYNKMTRALLEDERKIKRYNQRLEEANFELNKSEIFLKLVIDSSPNSIILTQLNGRIQLFNKKACSDFGMNQTEAIGLNIDDLLAHTADEARKNQKRKDPNSLEILCRRADGTTFPAYINIAPVKTDAGETTANLYIIRDISESKGFQEMMVRLDRYYTKGEMAGDIAHEINNFLAILSGNIELFPLFLKKNDPEKISSKLELMKTTCDRIAKFTDGLLDVGEENTNFVKEDINHMIKTILEFLKPQNKFDYIEIKTNLSDEIPLVMLDIGQIQQVVVNLTNNAAEAINPQEGDKLITISTFMTERDGKPHLAIEVRDNGPGVAKEKAELLFDQRFTTKTKGHGIGLVTCRKISNSHNGHLSYRYDNGSVFQLEIPVEQANVAMAETEEESLETTLS